MNRDIELAMRLTTGIKNGDEFFTDLNGFQVIIQKKVIVKLTLTNVLFYRQSAGRLIVNYHYKAMSIQCQLWLILKMII